MAGFSGHCLWDRDQGRSIDAAALPLSAATLRDLALWARQRWGSWSDPAPRPAWGPADMEALDEQGR
jgi:hypothetical protein